MDNDSRLHQGDPTPASITLRDVKVGSKRLSIRLIWALGAAGGHWPQPPRPIVMAVSDAPRACCCPARSGWSWTAQLAAGDHRAARVCRILSTACTKSASWLEVRARLSAIYPRGAM